MVLQSRKKSWSLFLVHRSFAFLYGQSTCDDDELWKGGRTTLGSWKQAILSHSIFSLVEKRGK